MATSRHTFTHDGIALSLTIEDRVIERVTIKELLNTHFHSSSWPCDNSPTGSCVYTDYIGFDCCIFCGDPEERK